MRNHLLANSLLYAKRNVVDIGGYGNILVLNSYSRASGVMHEWEKNRGSEWAPQRMSG